MSEKEKHESASGVWYAAAAFTAWGILPLYWKVLQQVPALEILSHRIFWSFLFVSFLLLFSGRMYSLRQVISDWSKLAIVFLGAILISANWFIYIWAVNANRVVEASLGYYINPLFNVFLGMVVLKERLNIWQLISILLAAMGVSVLTIQYGSIPWVALSLALTFGLYGLVKKMTNLDSLTGLTLETAFVAPLALGYLFLQQFRGSGSFGVSYFYINFLLMCSGVVTALPLLWFSQGAKRVRLSTLGFLQYLSPSISLFLGVFIFKEHFTKTHLLSFGFIWCALTLYAFSQTSLLPQLQPGFLQTRERG
ncbi:EamA family transporter RarD [Thermanaerosceptrum fracticalcis]|uniref:EamA family transporter RarD n=1 Tax=Thermanaerosceptrum fracticalcis TaxID=1712410 RepID=A0A7G6E3R5_THEFR|nr:EamA family transporter RarD [Thermanaerosceptrum fracticalcis]QNB46719.1 EamA family transporter RarD [Thermanaerosceptrum fracticalcis]